MFGVNSVWKVGGAMTIASLLSLTALTVPASAAALFVHRGATNAAGENTCLGMAFDAARDQRLQNIQHGHGSVSGAKDDKFVVMICVGNVVVISVAGDHPQEVQPLAEALFKNISSISTF